MRRDRGLRRPDRGSVAVEYMGMLPLLLLVAMLVLQALLAVVVTTAAEDAARVAARAASDSTNPGVSARDAARESLPGWLDDRIEDLDVSGDGDLVTAEIDVSVPAVASLVSGRTVSGSATFERG